MLMKWAGVPVVAAGIGIAVVSGWGCAVATADPADTGSPSSGDSASDKSPSTAGQASSAKDTAQTDGKDSDGPQHRTGRDDELSSVGEDESERKDSTPKSRSGDSDRPNQSPAGETDNEPVSKTTDFAAQAAAEAQVVTELTTTEVVLPKGEIYDVAADAPVAEATDAVTDAAPGAPVHTPAEWALLAAARREIGVTAGDTRSVGPLVAATVVTEEPLPANWEDQYVGAPTLIHQLVVAGLRVVDVVLKPFGGLLKFTSLKVPFFTDGVPPFFLRHGLTVQRTEFDGMPVWTLQPKNATDEYIVALHGGAYVAEASLFHWWTYTDMARETGATVVVPLYPLVPDGGTASVAVPKTADFIEQLIAQRGAQNVSVIGDSAGGGLALAAVQELVVRGSAVPSRMVLFAPWLDAGVGNSLSSALDPGDPLLDVPNLQQAGRDWAGELGTLHRYASPLYGSLEGLPPITGFSGSLDLLTPDTLRLQQRVAEGGYTNFTFDLRRDLIHDWGIFAFLPDAHAIRPSVYRALLG
ncbi:alpha/beta hydrolase fold domain-containing protein [Mycobacterium deserti]|uniref:Alpha/beta hydrolase fold domain-containing protein n=1 Tax=Mycobacterium deserti TaxID=2978347 RepID=A0ABT2MED5_9MYCO|nr:alpha/beta hydrolase fold domain-containing protein [Mycobacterium deserti]MCT7660635.1 alpha/beta hydrolase fold domain-containing protein [Mycobacterium deserti]